MHVILALQQTFVQWGTCRELKRDVVYLGWPIKPSYMSPKGGEGSCGVSANEYSCTFGAQINFGDLTPYLSFGYMYESTLYCTSLQISEVNLPHLWPQLMQTNLAADLRTSLIYLCIAYKPL